MLSDPPIGATAARIPGAIFWIGVAYALIPVASVLLWLVLGDGPEVRYRVPVDLLQFVEIGTFILALKLGMSRTTLRVTPNRAEAVALVVLCVAFAYGLATAAPEPAAGLNRAIMRLPHLFFAFSLCYLLGQGRPEASLWITGAVVAYPLLHLPIVAIVYNTHFDDPQMWLGGPLGFWHVRIWGIALAAAIAAALGLYASREDLGRGAHLLAFAVFAVFWTMLFWSGTRSGIFGVVVSIVFSTAVFPRQFVRRLPLFGAATVIGVLLSMTLAPPIEAYGIFNILEEGRSAATINDLSSNRIMIWTETLRMVWDRPVFGHGHDQYTFLYMGGDTGKLHAHNAVVDMLLDYGFVGAGCFIFLLLSLWWRGLRRVIRGTETWKFGALTMLNALAAMAMLEGVLYHNEPLGLVAIGFAVLLARPVTGGTRDSL